MRKKSRRPTIIIAMNAFRAGGSQTYAFTLAQVLSMNGFHIILVGKHGLWSNKARCVANTKRVFWREGAAVQPSGPVKTFILKGLEEFSAIQLKRAVNCSSLIISSQPGPTAFFAEKKERYWPSIPQVALVHGTTTVEWPFRNHGETIQSLSGLLAATYETLKVLQRESQGIPTDLVGNLFRSKLYWDSIDSPTAEDYDRDGPIVFLGTLTRNKTGPLEILISAMTYNDLKLIIVGGGPELANLRILVNELSLVDRVVFVGPVDDPRPWITKSSVIVTAGRGAIEALSAGRVVIVATTDGVHGLVRLRDIDELEAFNFTGRTPKSRIFTPYLMNCEILDAAAICFPERNSIAARLSSVGSVEAIISKVV